MFFQHLHRPLTISQPGSSVVLSSQSSFVFGEKSENNKTNIEIYSKITSRIYTFFLAIIIIIVVNLKCS